MKEPEDIDINQFKEEPDTDTVGETDVLTQYEEGRNPDPEDPDVIDIPFDDLIDTKQDQDNGITIQDVDGMTLEELMHAVFRRGSVMFSDGRMLTKCVGYDLPAMCGMYPMPHPETGDPIMTCTGPIIA